MRTLFVFVLSFFLTESCLYSQKCFQRTYGGKRKENAYQVLQTDDKGFMTVGSTESFGAGKSDIYVVKIDSAGNMEWAKAYGGTNDDYGHYMDKTKDGNYVIVGHSTSYSVDYNDICIIKIDSKGNVLWSKSYGLDRSDYSNNIFTMKDGGFVIIGETINFLNHEKNSDILVIRTDFEGKVLWARVYGGNNTDYAYSVEETNDGGFVIGGETNSYGAGEWDFYLLKLKSDGSVQWSKTYGESKTDYGRFAIETPEGGFIIGGNTFNLKSLDIDICLAKLNKHGDVEWAKIYGGTDTDYLLSLKMIDEERFAAIGYTNSFNLTVEDAFLMIFNISGKVKCAKAFGSKWNDYGVALTSTADEGIVMCGTTKGFDVTEEDVYVVKTYPKRKVDECNMNGMYPLNSDNVKLKVGTGHYEVELHCQEENIDVIITNTVTAEQVLCTEDLNDE